MTRKWSRLQIVSFDNADIRQEARRNESAVSFFSASTWLLTRVSLPFVNFSLHLPVGLARQTHNGTVLQSAVGTISFSCPEIVMHESYTDKADIWSLGWSVNGSELPCQVLYVRSLFRF